MAFPLLIDDVRRALTAGRLGHLTTLNPDGSPQVSVVRIGLEGDDIVIGHLMSGRKVTNIASDARVALTVEAEGANPPAGNVIHITPERIGGVGPWAD